MRVSVIIIVVLLAVGSGCSVPLMQGAEAMASSQQTPLEWWQEFAELASRYQGQDPNSPDWFPYKKHYTIVKKWINTNPRENRCWADRYCIRWGVKRIELYTSDPNVTITHAYSFDPNGIWLLKDGVK